MLPLAKMLKSWPLYATYWWQLCPSIFILRQSTLRDQRTFWRILSPDNAATYFTRGHLVHTHSPHHCTHPRSLRAFYWGPEVGSLFSRNKHMEDIYINQSINETSIAPISPARPGSVTRQPNQRSSAKSRKQFHDINRPWGVTVSMGGEGQIKEVCLQIFLEGSNCTGWTDRQREVVPKGWGTRVKSSSTSIGLDPWDWQTIIIVWTQ